jgi:hypothetical protein
MNKDLWIAPITKKACPPWPCPTCGVGTISLIPNLLVEQESAESEAYAQANGSDPEFFESTFYAFARCGHQSCQEWIALIGKGRISVERSVDDEDNLREEYVEYYEVVPIR